MGLKEIEDIELDERGKPVIPFDKELSFIVKWLTVIETFLFAVTIGYIYAVAQAPVIYFLSCITGFLHVFISWIIGFVSLGLFAGQWSWVNSLFTLLKNEQFRTGSLLLLVIFFHSRVMAGTLARIGYERRKRACLILLVFIAINTALLFRLIGNEQEKYLFMYGIIFCGYSILAYPRKKKVKERK